LTFASKPFQILQGTALAAAYNVPINIDSLKDRSFANRCPAEVEKTTARIRAAVARLAAKLDDALHWHG
jgi:formiminotetrahydrofolate cyclodeaminase